jgi:SAM-dependent methyltransferase
MTVTVMQKKLEEINQKNEKFWNELCGSNMAKQIGVVDASIESLVKFDDCYLDYYPYLKKYLLLDEIEGKNVLEVGLGYGTVSQLLALAGANYHGLDVAPNAVSMVKHRLNQKKREGDVRVGNILACPFPDNYFDYVISIGCFHHTGDMQQCVDEVYRTLKKGGKAVIMVYNKYSFRQWLLWPVLTAKNLFSELLGKRSNSSSSIRQRRVYDRSATNQEGAPETAFFSVSDVENIFNQYQSVTIKRENFDDRLKLGKVYIYPFGKRSLCLSRWWVRYLGLDLYIEVTK